MDRRAPLARLVAPALLTLALATPVLVTPALVAPARAAESTVEHGILESFDGTPIAYSLFLPGSTARAPVIFHTHGWGGSRTKEPTGTVGMLLDEGYAVLTWDARGFGHSGGEANIDSQQFEVRDVQALIDFVATRAEILLDREGDPRMGMVGGSYAGGIQLMTAAADDRIDAIVPQIAWHDLVQSLKPGGVLKLGWGTLLYAAGAATASTAGMNSPAGPQTGVYARQIHEAYAQATALNDWTDVTRDWFDARGPEHYIAGGRRPGLGIARALPGIDAPALIIQGVNDTLFPLNEGIANLRAIRANGVEASLIVFCGGHSINAAGTSCATDPPDGPSQADVIDAAILSWFDRHVRAPLRDVPQGPAIRYQLQDGSFEHVARLPSSGAQARGSGRLVNTVAPTSGVLTAAQPSRDGIRFEVPVRAGSTLLGIPRARVTVSGTGPEAYLFFKLLDVGPDGRAIVLDDQTMPKKVAPLTAAGITFGMDLAGVSWRMQDGHRLFVEISATSNDHNSSRVPFVAEVEAAVTVPVVGSGARVLGRSDSSGGRTQVLPATGVASAPLLGVVLIAAAAALSRRRSMRRS